MPASFADSDEVKNDEKDQEENEDAANDEVHSSSSSLDSLFLPAKSQILMYYTLQKLSIFANLENIYDNAFCIFLNDPKCPFFINI